jgi:hypothetical protein
MITLIKIFLYSWRALAVTRLDNIRTSGILMISRENSSERLDRSWPICSKALAQMARHCSVLSFFSCNRSRSAATSSEIDGEEWICSLFSNSRRCSEAIAQIARHCLMLSFSSCNRSRSVEVSKGWTDRREGLLLDVSRNLPQVSNLLKPDVFYFCISLVGKLLAYR